MKFTTAFALPLVAVLVNAKPDFMSMTKSPNAPRIHPDGATRRTLTKFGRELLPPLHNALDLTCSSLCFERSFGRTSPMVIFHVCTCLPISLG